MKINKEYIERMTIEEFADKHGIEMEIIERKPRLAEKHGRFIAHFKEHPDTSEGYVRRSVYGDGDTEEGAIKDYAKAISSKTLIFGYAYSREIEVPILI